MKLTLFLIAGLALLSPPAARAEQDAAGQNCEQHADRVYATREVDEKARITRRPEPRYPARVRGRRGSGHVKVRAVLRPDGTVTDVEVLDTTDVVYNQTSIEAAKKITFEPAQKGGCPVAQAIILFYGYRTY